MCGRALGLAAKKTCRPIEATAKQRPTREARRKRAPAQEKSWTHHTQDVAASAWADFEDDEQDGHGKMEIDTLEKRLV